MRFREFYYFVGSWTGFWCPVVFVEVLDRVISTRAYQVPFPTTGITQEITKIPAVPIR